MIWCWCWYRQLLTSFKLMQWPDIWYDIVETWIQRATPKNEAWVECIQPRIASEIVLKVYCRKEYSYIQPVCPEELVDHCNTWTGTVNSWIDDWIELPVQMPGWILIRRCICVDIVQSPWCNLAITLESSSWIWFEDYIKHTPTLGVWAKLLPIPMRHVKYTEERR